MEPWDTPEPDDLVQRWVTRICHLLVSLLLVCVLVSVVQVGRQLQPGWQGGYLILSGWVAAVEAIASQRYLHTGRRGISFEGEAIYRAVEWVVLLLGLKLLIYVVQGFDLLLADLATWPSGFLESFFSGEYLLACLVCFLAWILATSMSSTLTALEVDAKGLSHEESMVVAQDRIEARRHLAVMVFAIGTLLVILAALLRQDISVLWSRAPAQRAGVYNVILYFMLGLVLLSLTQFTILRSRWVGNQYQVNGRLSRTWLGYSFAFLLILAIISAFLPTAYSIGLLDTLKIVFHFLMAVVSLIGMLLSAPFYLLLLLLSRLLGRAEPPMQPPDLDFRFQPPEAAPAATGPDALKSILFWVFFLSVITLSLLYYLRNNPVAVGLFSKFPITRWLATFLTWLLQSLKKAGRSMASAVESGVKRLLARGEGQAARPWNPIRLRRLSSRQKVLFYYLAMVRRGGESGLERKPAQTPGEYSAAMLQKLGPEAPPGAQAGETNGSEIGGDILSLTEKFMQARYSRDKISHDEASQVQRTWTRLRSALRRIHL